MAIKIIDIKPAAACLITAMLLFHPGCGCSEKSEAETDAAIDAHITDAGDADIADADASPSLPDGETQHTFCDEPFFKLPIHGPTQETYHLTMWKEEIVYSVTEPNTTKRDIYLMDLSTCIEKRISYSGRGTGAAVDDEKIIWRDSRNASDDPYHCDDFFKYDFSVGQEERITNNPECKGGVTLYGDWLAYRQAESTTSERTNLILTKYGSGEEKIIVPGTWLPISPVLSERYLVFGAQSIDSTSMGRDAYYYDLVEETLNRVTETSDIFCNQLQSSGDWFMYAGSYYSMQMPFRVGLYNIPEKRHIALSPDEDAIPSIALHEKLAAWTTMIYSGIHYAGPVDIEMYDIKQETRRRLTKESGGLGAIAMFFPYLVMADAKIYTGNILQNDFYVANLVKLGITDEDGNLLPGEGVIEPP